MKIWIIIGEIIMLLVTLLPDFAKDMRKSTIPVQLRHSPMGFALLITCVTSVLILAWPILVASFLQGLMSGRKK